MGVGHGINGVRFVNIFDSECFRQPISECDGIGDIECDSLSVGERFHSGRL